MSRKQERFYLSVDRFQLTQIYVCLMLWRGYFKNIPDSKLPITNQLIADIKKLLYPND